MEVQIIDYDNLASRITYNWCDIYSQQLQSGQDYLELKPTYAIWLLADDLIDNDKAYAHRIKLRDEKGKVVLNDCGGIYLFELRKFAAEQVKNEEQRWLKFFKEGDSLDDEALPEWICLQGCRYIGGAGCKPPMNTEEMKQAMATLRGFSEKERDYFAYQARQEFLREQRTVQRELEMARQAREAAVREKDSALREKDSALREKDSALREKDAALQRLREQAIALQTAARHLLDMGLAPDQVARATGLDEAEVRALGAAGESRPH